MRKLLFAIAFIAAFCASTANANTVTIDFTWYGSDTGTVVFTGTPESDGLINLADLTALTFSDNSGQTFNLSSVDAFGTFNTETDTWLSNAADWYGDLDAYLTSSYGGGPNSWSFADVYWEQPLTVTVVSDTGGSTVPEPTSIALLGLGIAGLVIAHRRKNA